MRLRDLPSPAELPERVATTVEPSGFTLVEEDDVAFSLQLCREVHRIYGEYQDGRLPTTESMLAGLVVTVEMLAALSRRVTDGMPGMRITVAAAQTREMMAVSFGQDPMQKPVQRRLRERYRSLVAESVGAAGVMGAGAVGVVGASLPELSEPGPRTTAPARPMPAAAPPGPSPAAPRAGEPLVLTTEPPRRSRLRGFFSRRRVQGPVPPPLPLPRG